MDHIHIRDLTARCIIGVTPDERREKQEVVVNLVVSTELGEAGRSDDFHRTVDYRTVKKRVLAVLEASQVHLLEALAEAVANACLEDPRIEQVRVTLDKPGALRFARSAGIEIVRRRR